MTHSTLISMSRRALQLATLFLAAAPVTFGGELVTSARDDQLIGQMVVTAARERPLIGHIVVIAGRLAPVNVAIADPWFNLRDKSERDLKALYHFLRDLRPAGEMSPAYIPPGETPNTPVVRFP